MRYHSPRTILFESREVTGTRASEASKAKRKGQHRFTSVHPCPRCGHTERYVSSGGCVPCQIARVQASRRNPLTTPLESMQ